MPTLSLTDLKFSWEAFLSATCLDHVSFRHFIQEPCFWGLFVFSKVCFSSAWQRWIFLVFMERCQPSNVVFVFYFPEFFKVNARTDGSQSAALRTQDAPAALALLWPIVSAQLLLSILRSPFEMHCTSFWFISIGLCVLKWIRMQTIARIDPRVYKVSRAIWADGDLQAFPFFAWL